MKSLAVGAADVAIYGPAQGLKRRASKLWILKRRVFNFCVRITRLRGHSNEKNKDSVMLSGKSLRNPPVITENEDFDKAKSGS